MTGDNKMGASLIGEAFSPLSSAMARAACSDGERRNADLLKVLIGQVTKGRKVYIVLGKALRVLGHAELFEPVRDLLHWPPPDGCTSPKFPIGKKAYQQSPEIEARVWTSFSKTWLA